jgi:hypothetical protein
LGDSRRARGASFARGMRVGGVVPAAGDRVAGRRASSGARANEA